MKEGLAGALFSLTTNQWRADYGLESIPRGSRLAKRTGESARNFIGHRSTTIQLEKRARQVEDINF